MVAPENAQANNIVIALSVNNMDKAIVQNFFNITINFIDNNVAKEVELKWCTPEDFKDLGPDYVQLYEQGSLYNFVSPNNLQDIAIDRPGQAVQLIVSPCLQSVNPDCIS